MIQSLQRLCSTVIRTKTGKCLVLGLSLATVVFLLKAAGLFWRVDSTILNMFYQKRQHVPENRDISVWTIYDEDLELAKWPWAWDKFSESVEMLSSHDTRLVVIMESVFYEPGEIILRPEMAGGIKEKILADATGNPSFDAAAALRGLAPDYNARFADAVKRSNRTIFSQQFVIPDHQNPLRMRQEAERRKEHFTREKKDAIEKIRRFGLKWDRAPGKLLQAIDVVPLTPMLSDTAAGAGFIRIMPDEDGVVRRDPTVVYYDGSLFFSQAVVAAAHYLGCRMSDIEVLPGKSLTLKASKPVKGGRDVKIPIDERGFMYVNWTGDEQLRRFNAYPFKLIRRLLMYEMGRKMIAGQDLSSEALGAFIEKYPAIISQMGLDNEDRISQICFEMALCWFMDSYLAKNSEAGIAEVVEEKCSAFGDKLDPINAAAIFESIRLNWTAAMNAMEGRDEPFEVLCGRLGISGNATSRKYLEYHITKTHLEVLQETGKSLPEEEVSNMAREGAMKDLELLLKAGLLNKHPSNMNGTTDEILNIECRQLPAGKLADRLISAGLAKDAEDLKKKKLSDFFGGYQRDITLLRKGYETVRFLASKQTLSGARPLYFPVLDNTMKNAPAIPTTPLSMKDQAVFIGLTATGLNAQNPTPYDFRDMMAGLAPAVFNTIVTGSFITRAAWAEYALVVAFAVLMAFATLNLRFYLTLPIFILLVAGHYTAAFQLFDRAGVIIAVNTPILSLVFGFVGALLYHYWEQQRERKKIREMFSAMVSPEVLKLMEEDPDKFNLQGVRMEASMFSSDVSGFTTISEGVTAEGLAKILNLYLTPMSNLVMIYGGYVEKYEGDAIKADFGMPVADPQHAWKACYSALLQQEELKVVQRMLLVKYGVNISARMGVNTGIVSAGNMGSENKMQYCALGEAVAMAEEFEPSNKMWDSWIAIGPETFRQAKEFIAIRHLDNVIYSHETIPVYEVLGWHEDRFLAYWEGKPIPALVIEGWDRIIPDKILAYLDYYRKKTMPGCAFHQLLLDSFGAIEECCIETLKLDDIRELHGIETDFRGIIKRLESHDWNKVFSALSPIDRADVARCEKACAEAAEPWKKTLVKYQFELRKCRFIVLGLLGSIDRKDYDKMEEIVDSLEKRIVCQQKRIQFPTPDDRIGKLFADHLKEWLGRTAEERAAIDAAPMAKKSTENRGRISAAAKEFIQKAKAVPLEYHRFMAAHCTIPESKLKTCELFEKGRSLYLQKKWREAAALFEEGLKHTPDDGPCRTFVKRCQIFEKDPPAEGWTGDWKANW